VRSIEEIREAADMLRGSVIKALVIGHLEAATSAACTLGALCWVMGDEVGIEGLKAMPGFETVLERYRREGV
jgi:hypothetical protein